MRAKDDILTPESLPSLPAEVTLQRLFPPAGESSRLTVSCQRADYSASAVARAVEDCDAHLLNLNITSDTMRDYCSDDIVVELRVSHRSPLAVARSLERYGFRVLATSGRDDLPAAAGDDADDPVRDRVNQLIHILDV